MSFTSNYINTTPNYPDPNYIVAGPQPWEYSPNTGFTCVGCGMHVGNMQVHQCPAQLTFPGSTPQQTQKTMFTNLFRGSQKVAKECEEARLTAIEAQIAEILEVIGKLSDNNQDEEVCVCSEEGHQSADEGGSSSRNRKGEWYWPTKS